MFGKFFNRNATLDGRHDALNKLGKQNQYNEGSSSWWAYEQAYDDVVNNKQQRSEDVK